MDVISEELIKRNHFFAIAHLALIPLKGADSIIWLHGIFINKNSSMLQLSTSTYHHITTSAHQQVEDILQPDFDF